MIVLGKGTTNKVIVPKSEQIIFISFPPRPSLQSFPCPVVPERAPSLKELPVDEKVGNIEIYLRIFGTTWEYLGLLGDIWETL